MTRNHIFSKNIMYFSSSKKISMINLIILRKTKIFVFIIILAKIANGSFRQKSQRYPKLLSNFKIVTEHIYIEGGIFKPWTCNLHNIIFSRHVSVFSRPCCSSCSRYWIMGKWLLNIKIQTKRRAARTSKDE